MSSGRTKFARRVMWLRAGRPKRRPWDPFGSNRVPWPPRGPADVPASVFGELPGGTVVLGGHGRAYSGHEGAFAALADALRGLRAVVALDAGQPAT